MDILMTPNSCLNNFIINYFLKELQNHYVNKHVAVLLTNDLTSYQDSQDKPQVVAKIRNSSNLSQGKTQLVSTRPPSVLFGVDSSRLGGRLSVRFGAGYRS